MDEKQREGEGPGPVSVGRELAPSVSADVTCTDPTRLDVKPLVWDVHRWHVYTDDDIELLDFHRVGATWREDRG